MVHQAQPHHEDLHVEEQPIETFIPAWQSYHSSCCFSYFRLFLLYTACIIFYLYIN